MSTRSKVTGAKWHAYARLPLMVVHILKLANIVSICWIKQLPQDFQGQRSWGKTNMVMHIYPSWVVHMSKMNISINTLDTMLVDTRQTDRWAVKPV